MQTYVYSRVNAYKTFHSKTNAKNVEYTKRFSAILNTTKKRKITEKEKKKNKTERLYLFSTFGEGSADPRLSPSRMRLAIIKMGEKTRFVKTNCKFYVIGKFPVIKFLSKKFLRFVSLCVDKRAKIMSHTDVDLSARLYILYLFTDRRNICRTFFLAIIPRVVKEIITKFQTFFPLN